MPAKIHIEGVRDPITVTGMMETDLMINDESLRGLLIGDASGAHFFARNGETYEIPLGSAVERPDHSIVTAHRAGLLALVGYAVRKLRRGR